MSANLDEISITFVNCSQHKSFKKAIANVILLIFLSFIFLIYTVSRIHDATSIEMMIAGSILSIFLFSITFGLYFIVSFMKIYRSEYKRKSKKKFKKHKQTVPKFK